MFNKALLQTPKREYWDNKESKMRIKKACDRDRIRNEEAVIYFWKYPDSRNWWKSREKWKNLEKEKRPCSKDIRLYTQARKMENKRKILHNFFFYCTTSGVEMGEGVRNKIEQKHKTRTNLSKTRANESGNIWTWRGNMSLQESILVPSVEFFSNFQQKKAQKWVFDKFPTRNFGKLREKWENFGKFREKAGNIEKIRENARKYEKIRET